MKFTSQALTLTLPQNLGANIFKPRANLVEPPRPSMIQARSLPRSSHRFLNGRVDLKSPSRSGYKFYSAFAGSTWTHELAANTPVRPPRRWRLGQSPFQRLSGSPALRFASTTPVPPPHEKVQTDIAPPPAPATPAEAETLPTSFDEVTSSIAPPVDEHLGFLKEMGLDYGWGPTAFVEYMLEHVHIYLGTPWWGSIVVTVLLTRIALFKPYIDAADLAARRQVIKPLDDPINDRIRVAKMENNTAALRQAWYDRNALWKSAGMVWWKSFVPLVQLPIGFGVFRLMRGMASLPVPGFDTGGLLWVSDLTIADPYYILPLASAVTYYYSIKWGGDTGSGDLVSQATQKLVMYIFPVVGGIMMTLWPAGLQLTMCVTAIIMCLQTKLFKKIWVRKLLGIQPIPKPVAIKARHLPRPQSDSETSTGVMGKIKGAMSDVVKDKDKYMPSLRKPAPQRRLTGGEIRHATVYEARRQKEIAREAAMRRDSVRVQAESERERATEDGERQGRQRRRQGWQRAR